MFHRTIFPSEVLLSKKAYEKPLCWQLAQEMPEVFIREIY